MRFGGREIIETNERVEGGSPTVRYFKCRARAHLAKYPPVIPSYHYKIEKVGFLKYAIVPYQNILEPE